MEITINQNENQLIELGNSNVQDIGINNSDNQIITLSNNLNNQDININQRDNQVIYIDGGGVSIGITDVLVNGVTVVSGNIAYITVPTKTSELQNNSGFITSETDPTVPSYIKQISLSDINSWNNKQDQLVSGSTIKTINNESLLGSGNINITGTQYNAGDGISIENDIISNTITSYNDLSDLPTLPTKTSDLINDSEFVSEDDLSEVAFTGSYNSLSDTPIIPDSTSDLINDSGFIDKNVNDLTYYTLSSNLSSVATSGNYNDLSNTPTIPTKTSDLTNDGADGAHPFIPNNDNLGNYGLKALTSDGLNLQYIIGPGNTNITLQDKLVSGTNIKTINNNSLLGSGNITISGGTPTDVQVNGTSITSNNVANLITNGTYNSSTNKIATMSDIPTNTSDLTNDSNFAVTNADNNFTYQQTMSGALILGTEGTSTDDSADLVFEYGNKNEKARIWTDNVLTSSNPRLNYRSFDKNGNSLINSQLATLEDIPVDTYSTSEIAIGKWINNKILYRKVISIPNFSTNGTSVQTGITNVDFAMMSGYFLRSNTNYAYPIGNYFMEELRFDTTTGLLQAWTTNANVEFYGYVIIEYTKS